MVFELDDSRVVPSVEMEDGLDYVTADSIYLADQHFSIIADAGPVTGPVTGPIIAGITFGWVPTLLNMIVRCSRYVVKISNYANS